MDLAIAIGATYKDDRFWAILLDGSEAQSGPSDGGCLICAKAIIRAAGGGELVRLNSTANGGQTEHYGAEIDGRIYDFNGSFDTPAAWMAALSQLENASDRELSFARGYDEDSDIPDDPRATKAIASLLLEHASEKTGPEAGDQAVGPANGDLANAGRATAPKLLKQELPLVRRINADLAAQGHVKGSSEYDRMFADMLSFYRQFGWTMAQPDSANSSLRKSTSRVTDTPAFKRWFGDSKVVDAQGQPLVVHHGTNADFDSFDNAKTGANDRGLWGRGHYFSASLDNANSYALRQGDGARVIPAYVSIKNPLILKTGSDLVTRLPDGTNTRELIGQNLDGAKIKQLALDGGHDGVIQIRPNGQIGDLVAYSPEQIKSATGNNGNFDQNDPSIVREGSADYNAGRPYTDDRQLQLFLDSGPDESQAGPRGQAAQRAAVSAVQALRSTESILALSLSRDYAARQRVSLVGQRVMNSRDLAVLAQVYRDPRFETFRVIFVDDGGTIVSQVGLTSRLPASVKAIIGDDTDAFLQSISETARSHGATGYYLLHNHPSGISDPSDADVALTQTFAQKMPALNLIQHVVIDTNEYSIIDRYGGVEKFHRDFSQPEPYRAQEWADMKISGPADVMAMAKRLQADEDAVTLIHTDKKMSIKTISTIPTDATIGEPGAVHRLIAKASLKTQGAELFAVSRNVAALLRLKDVIRDGIHVAENGEVTSLSLQGLVGGAPFPRQRRTRVTPDTSPEFAYLRQGLQPTTHTPPPEHVPVPALQEGPADASSSPNQAQQGPDEKSGGELGEGAQVEFTVSGEERPGSVSDWKVQASWRNIKQYGYVYRGGFDGKTYTGAVGKESEKFKSKEDALAWVQSMLGTSLGIHRQTNQPEFAAELRAMPQQDQDAPHEFQAQDFKPEDAHPKAVIDMLAQVESARKSTRRGSESAHRMVKMLATMAENPNAYGVFFRHLITDEIATIAKTPLKNRVSDDRLSAALIALQPVVEHMAIHGSGDRIRSVYSSALDGVTDAVDIGKSSVREEGENYNANALDFAQTDSDTGESDEDDCEAAIPSPQQG